MILSSVKLYHNTGYCAGGHHIPKWTAGPSELSGSAPLEFTNVKPSKEDPFILDLPIEYFDAITYTYIEIVHETPQLPQNHKYGWITNVDLIGTRGTIAKGGTIAKEICRITWQPDHWRTWARFATFKSGHVLRQPSEQTYRRTWCQGLVQHAVYGSSQSLIDGISESDIYYPDKSYLTNAWAIVRYIESGTPTRIRTLIWPIGSGIYDEYGTQGRYTGPSQNTIYTGLLDEALGILPENVIGAWVLPCCPIPQAFKIADVGFGYNWSFRDGSHYGDVIALTSVSGQPDPAAFRMKIEYDISLPDLMTASMPTPPTGLSYTENTITNSVSITDMVGRMIWTLPANLKIKNTFHIGWEIGTVSAYCLLHFEKSDSTTLSYSESSAEGLIVTIPLISIPISSNTWQSYNVSGQRDYDIESAKAANNAAYKKGLANTGSQAVEGAIGGALVGGGPAAAAGAAIGAVFNVISSSIGKTIDEELRQKVQALKDTAVANQAQYMISPGDGFYWTQSGGFRILVMQAMDNGECAADIAENGYHADLAISSWTPATGPWQIERLDVTGPIPTEARVQIRNMLAAGVYIDS